MTQEDIIRMAREAGGTAFDCTVVFTYEEARRFMALAAAAERQRCAQIARQFDVDHPNTNYGGFIARLIEGDK
jgi:hypothetical protein